MAYVQQRGTRFTGYYRDKFGKKQSAGTYTSKAEALHQAQRAEEVGTAGGFRLTMTLSDYVKHWLPTADLLPMTKKNYESTLRTHVLPILGRKTVGAISRSDVRQMLDTLRQAGYSASIRQQAKASLGSALKALVEVDQLEVNPTHKIAIKKIDNSEYRDVLEPEQFKAIVEELPTDEAKLFATLLVSSGLRFGEASELRARDLNFATDELYVQRRVSDLGAVRNGGARFLVIQGTKSGRKRSLVLTEQMIQRLSDHVNKHDIQSDQLLFSLRLVKPSASNNAVVNTTGHLPRDTWRRMWKQACANAGIHWLPRTHDLRHANATVMLKNGVDLHEVKERLGHSSIRTTEGYLHRMKSQQSKASHAVSEFL